MGHETAPQESIPVGWPSHASQRRRVVTTKTTTERSASQVETDDFVVLGEGFARQWAECMAERAAYAYTIPYPEDAWYPWVECWFSETPFTRGELRKLCAQDHTPLVQRALEGEERCGFRWALPEMQLLPQTSQARAIVERALDKKSVHALP